MGNSACVSAVDSSRDQQRVSRGRKGHVANDIPRVVIDVLFIAFHEEEKAHRVEEAPAAQDAATKRRRQPGQVGKRQKRGDEERDVNDTAVGVR